MQAASVVCLVMAAVFFALGCMNQRKAYWFFAAWKYRKPEANEPSGAALGVNRIAFFVGSGALLVVAAVFNGIDDANAAYSTAEVRSVAESAKSELDQGSEIEIDVSFLPTYDLYEAVKTHGGTDVVLRSVGEGKYELTNRLGENPVCLTVEVDDEPSPGGPGERRRTRSKITSIDDGPC